MDDDIARQSASKKDVRADILQTIKDIGFFRIARKWRIWAAGTSLFLIIIGKVVEVLFGISGHQNERYLLGISAVVGMLVATYVDRRSK
jgi:hypothetical protein